MEQHMNKSNILTSLALGSLVTLSGCANNPFAAEPMQDGYKNSAKAQEAKCGGSMDKKAEGSCCANMDKKADGSCAAHASSMDKKADGSCAASMDKSAEGKCGEGKCGANK